MDVVLAEGRLLQEEEGNAVAAADQVLAGQPPRGSETASRVYATAAAAQQQHRTPATSPLGSHTHRTPLGFC